MDTHPDHDLSLVDNVIAELTDRLRCGDDSEVSHALLLFRLRSIDAKLDRVLANQSLQLEEEKHMSQAEDDLKAEVEVIKADFAGAFAAISAEQASIADLTNQLAALTAAGASSVPAADVAAITADLKTSSANLEALLAAATAATAPAPPVVPPAQ